MSKYDCVIFIFYYWKAAVQTHNFQESGCIADHDIIMPKNGNLGYLK